MSVESISAKWLRRVEGMMFMERPVQDMTASELLEVVGFLATERDNLLSRQWELESRRITDIAAARRCATSTR